jgi:hypothetical protein
MLIAVSSIRDGCELIKIRKEEVKGELEERGLGKSPDYEEEGNKVN